MRCPLGEFFVVRLVASSPTGAYVKCFASRGAWTGSQARALARETPLGLASPVPPPMVFEGGVLDAGLAVIRALVARSASRLAHSEAGACSRRREASRGSGTLATASAARAICPKTLLDPNIANSRRASRPRSDILPALSLTCCFRLKLKEPSS